MQKTLQVILIIWLIVASALLFIPAIALIRSPQPSRLSILPPPNPPDLPTVPAFAANATKELREEQGKAYAKYLDAQISRYNNQVTAYKEQLSAVKGAYDANAQANLFNVYQLVAKETLASLINGLIIALAGYVFIKAGGEAVAKYQAAKRTQ